MNEPRWILDNTVHAIHKTLLTEHGGATGVRDTGMLESALARPKNTYAYNAEATIFELAAAYSFGLAKNHPFIDGNKRIAFTVAAVFLEINGFTLTASEPEAVIVFMDLAAGKLTEHELTEWFRSSSEPVSSD